jgi:hypothetical protein
VPLPPDVRTDLLTLFTAVESERGHVSDDQSEPFLLTGSPDSALLFRGESLELLRRLQTKLALSALAKGGPSRKAVESLLIEACWRSTAEGPEPAISALEEWLREPLEKWLIVEPSNVFLPVEQATIGACEVARELAEDIASPIIFEAAKEDLAGPVIKTRDFGVAAPNFRATGGG